MSGQRFRLRGATSGIPSDIPILGERKPVARLQVLLYNDGTSQVAIPGDDDIAAIAFMRLLRALLAGGGAMHVIPMPNPEQQTEQTQQVETAETMPEAQGDGDPGVPRG